MNDYPPLKKYVILPEPFIIANYYEGQVIRSLYTDINILRAAYEETGYFEVVLKENLNLLII